MVWTRFMDMHSGGGCKEPPYEHIYIEAPEDLARRIFYARFGHDPDRVTCDCCGEDYSVNEGPTLRAVTAFERDCRWAVPPDDPRGGRYFEHDEVIPEGWRHTEMNKYKTNPQTLDEYRRRDDVLLIAADEIAADELVRAGTSQEPRQ